MEITQKQFECLEQNCDKFTKALFKLIPLKDHKKAFQLLSDIIEMELQLEAECNE